MDGGKKCYMCGCFEVYYTRGVKRYNKTKYGWCMHKCANVGLHDGCEDWMIRRKCKASNRQLCDHLNNLLTEISEIRRFVEGENDENM